MLVVPAQSSARTNPPVRGRQRGAGIAAIGIFAVLSILGALSSQDFLEADGCTHYLYARFAPQEPHFFTNVWGRPLFTALYAFPSSVFGLTGAHLLSLILAIACGTVALLVARRQEYRCPVLALFFTLAQPLVFLHSFSELTELPFALLIGLAFLAFQAKQWLAMAILLALGPLGRPEGFGFLLLGATALVVHRRWWWALVLPIPLILWNHTGWVLSGREVAWSRWLISNWPYSSQSLYRAGSIFHYVALLPAVTSPFIFPATCIGIWQSLRAGLMIDRHRRICQMLIALIPLLMLAAHSILYATGRLASSGELRYLLVVAPFWGLLSACGWEWVFAEMKWRHPLRWAGVAALAGGLGNMLYPVVPIRATGDRVRSQQFVDWYHNSGTSAQFPRVCTAQMCIYFLLDVSPTDRDRALEFRRDRVSTAPAGTILVWDPTYSLYNSDARRSIPAEDLRQYGWIELTGTTPAPGPGWRLFTSSPVR
jgi:hypothetical protein